MTRPPGLDCHDSCAIQVRQRTASFDVLLTTYEFMMGKSDAPRLSGLQYEYLIVDEAHRLKNASCKLNKEMKVYSAKSRLLLTGTSLEALQCASRGQYKVAAGHSCFVLSVCWLLACPLSAGAETKVSCRNSSSEQFG